MYVALGNGKVESVAIRVAALRALRDAVDFHDANQARLFSAEVTRERGKGAVVPNRLCWRWDVRR